MSPWLAKMLAMLLVLGYTAGFETKMCNHEETVENIKKTYECAVDFGKNFIKKGKELASGGINNISIRHQKKKKLVEFSTKDRTPSTHPP